MSNLLNFQIKFQSLLNYTTLRISFIKIFYQFMNRDGKRSSAAYAFISPEKHNSKLDVNLNCNIENGEKPQLEILRMSMSRTFDLNISGDKVSKDDSSNDKKADYRLLPWGNLREPLKNIDRANCVIYTKTENQKTPAIHSIIQPLLKTNPINSSLLPILMKYNTSSYQKSLPPDKPIFAFCGIAEPISFINSAEELFLKVEGRKFFQDHQKYTKIVIQELSEEIKASSISHVVTTEKDMVKLPESFLVEFEVYIIKIDVIFKN